MSTTTSERIPGRIYTGARKMLTLMLMRFERDALSLGDYLSREEQDAQLSRIRRAITIHMMIEHHWPVEPAEDFVNAYIEALKYRLVNAAWFKTPSKLRD